MRIDKKRRMKWLSALLVGAGCLVFSQAAVAGGFDATSVNRCKECHEAAVNSFQAGNSHVKAWGARKDDKVYNCETCHGPGEKHMKDKDIESIISFSPEKISKRTSQEQAKACLTCHSTQSKELTFWEQGTHNRNDVSCASCHTMHAGAEKAKPSSETCFKCHKDVKSQVGKYSHHPIIEGKVGCNDCHNPHGTMGEKNLRAENVNQLCYKCHADKRGPFLYEHAPVAENCMNCHRAHGSQHARLLTEKQPALCMNCHNSSHFSVPWDTRTGFGDPTNPTGFGSTGALNGNIKTSARSFTRSCLNCYGSIHGSNHAGKSGLSLTR